MTKKFVLALFAVLVILALAVSSVGAITDGELDGEGHPHVVLLLMEVGGEPMYRCSGTLLSPTVLLTAGHCTSTTIQMNLFLECAYLQNQMLTMVIIATHTLAITP